MINALGEPQSLLLLGGTSDIALAVAEKYAASGGLRVVLAARPGPRRTDAAARLTALGPHGRGGRLRRRATPPATPALVAQAARAVATSTSPSSPSACSATRRRPGRTTTPRSRLAAGQLRRPGQRRRGARPAGPAPGPRRDRRLSSVAGERVRRSNFVYGSTKAGVDGFYLGLGEALREHGGHVLVVRPGFVRTKMTEGRERGAAVGHPRGGRRRRGRRRRRAARSWSGCPAAMRFVMSGLRHVPRPLFRRLPL